MKRNTEYGRLSPVVETFRNRRWGHWWVRFFGCIWILRHRYFAPGEHWDEVRISIGRADPLALAEPFLQLRWSSGLKAGAGHDGGGET